MKNLKKIRIEHYSFNNEKYESINSIFKNLLDFSKNIYNI